MYHPTAEELSASIGIPMDGFLDRANVAFATPTTPAVAYGVLAEAPIPPSEPVPKEEGTILGGLMRPHPFLPGHLFL